MRYYTSKILQCGELAEEFFSEGVIVFFGQQAPEELQEYSVTHEHTTPPSAELQAGDIITINGRQIEVLAVGGVVNENFRNLGHLVVKFNNSTEVEMAGDVNVAQITPLPRPMPQSEFTIDRVVSGASQ